MDSAFGKRLLDLENQYWRSIKDKDVDLALRLTDDACILTGAQGVAKIDKPTFAKMMEAPDWTLHDFALSDISVAQLSEDVAVIGYKVRENLTVDGKPVEVEAADSSTWVRKNGEWLCAQHSEAIAGDPYGRDRRKQ